MKLSFSRPMLCAKLKAGFNPALGRWVAEEKFDGIRLIAVVNREVPEDLLTDSTVRIFSRNGLDHVVPPHIRANIRRLPTGIYDMEMYGQTLRSYGATALIHADKMRLAVFDLMHLFNDSTLDLPLCERRLLLEEMFSRSEVRTETMELAQQRPVGSWEDVLSFRDEVWARDGEGLILKNLDTLYRPNSRRQGHWIKIKKLQTAMLTVVGFEPSKGEVYDRGPHAIIVLEDAEGFRAKVKTPDDAQIARFDNEAHPLGPAHHPAIGRKLWIEFQERTPDRAYRHPMFDRWATKLEETEAELSL